MSSSESLLWRMGRDPVLRSNVTVVSLLDKAPQWERLRLRVLQASENIPRLREVVVEPPLGVGSPAWAEASDFDLDYHLRRVRLAQQPSFAHVLEYAAREAMAEFDPARPLWEFTVIEGVGAQAALVQKFHHSLADGLGGMQLELLFLDNRERPASLVRPLDSEKPGAPAGAGPSPIGQLTATGARTTSRACSLARTLLEAGATPVSSARAAAETARWAGRLLGPVRVPLSPVMRERGIMLSFAAFDVDLGRLRAAGRCVDGTLNDAFIAAVAAGLRRYHQQRGSPVSRLRMTLPISIRREGDSPAGNRFTPVRFELPLEPADPALAIPAISAIVRQWREGPALGLTDALATVLNGLPTPAVVRVFGSMLRNVDFVATNVPGLPFPSYLAGAEILRQYAFAPPSGAAVNVALLSHVGRCCIGVNLDRAAIPDTEVFVEALEEGFEEVMALSGPGATGSGVAAAGRRP